VLSPTGTSCGATCTSYSDGTSVLLVVTPSPGYLFIGWGGDCSGSNTAAGVVMNGDKACVANVVPTLEVAVSGKGGGTVSDSLGGITDCAASCTEPVSRGTTVGLTATVATGYSFGGWSGDCSGTGVDTMITMDAPKSCTAAFVPDAHLLTVEVANGVGGSIDYGASTPCSSTCSRIVHYGDPVTLVAQPQRGYVFQGWSGDCTGNQPQAKAQVQGDIKCTATFAVDPDGGVPSDAGSSDGGQCNSIVNKGQLVKVVQLAQNPPPYQGGPLIQGTYVLTAATIYTGPGGAAGLEGTTLEETIVYFGGPTSGPLMVVLSIDGGADQSINAVMSSAAAVASLTVNYQCGPLTQDNDSYTSLPGELHVYNDSLKTEWDFMRIGPVP
jgi:uncharacterized repeat protein (TIGR02543 family)